MTLPPPGKGGAVFLSERTELDSPAKGRGGVCPGSAGQEKENR